MIFSPAVGPEHDSYLALSPFGNDSFCITSACWSPLYFHFPHRKWKLNGVLSLQNKILCIVSQSSWTEHCATFDTGSLELKF